MLMIRFFVVVFCWVFVLGCYVVGGVGGEVVVFEVEVVVWFGIVEVVGMLLGIDVLLVMLMVFGFGLGDEVIILFFLFVVLVDVIVCLGVCFCFVDVEVVMLNFDLVVVVFVMGLCIWVVFVVYFFGCFVDGEVLCVVCVLWCVELFEDVA